MLTFELRFPGSRLPAGAAPSPRFPPPHRAEATLLHAATTELTDDALARVAGGAFALRPAARPAGGGTSDDVWIDGKVLTAENYSV